MSDRIQIILKSEKMNDLNQIILVDSNIYIGTISYFPRFSSKLLIWVIHTETGTHTLSHKAIE